MEQVKDTGLARDADLVHYVFAVISGKNQLGARECPVGLKARLRNCTNTACLEAVF